MPAAPVALLAGDIEAPGSAAFAAVRRELPMALALGAGNIAGRKENASPGTFSAGLAIDLPRPFAGKAGFRRDGERARPLAFAAGSLEGARPVAGLAAERDLACSLAFETCAVAVDGTDLVLRAGPEASLVTACPVPELGLGMRLGANRPLVGAAEQNHA